MASGNTLRAISARGSRIHLSFTSPNPGMIASPMYSSGMKSGSILRLCRASAVLGPMAATLTPCPSPSGRGVGVRVNTTSTALTDVKITQVYLFNFSNARSSATLFSIGWISMTGKKTGSKPATRSLSANSSAWARGRVTRIFMVRERVDD